MSRTKNFRDQHAELIEITTQIAPHLNVDELSKDASEAFALLSKLLSKLNIHLALEDKSLYPRLLKHTNEQISSMAKDFMEEMGGIGEVIKGYKKTWEDEHKIQANPSAFIEQTNGIFEALSVRIDKENNHLYKIVDEMS